MGEGDREAEQGEDGELHDFEDLVVVSEMLRMVARLGRILRIYTGKGKKRIKNSY